jgi:hypothetical protein
LENWGKVEESFVSCLGVGGLEYMILITKKNANLGLSEVFLIKRDIPEFLLNGMDTGSHLSRDSFLL